MLFMIFLGLAVSAGLASLVDLDGDDGHASDTDDHLEQPPSDQGQIFDVEQATSDVEIEGTSGNDLLRIVEYRPDGSFDWRNAGGLDATRVSASLGAGDDTAHLRGDGHIIDGGAGDDTITLDASWPVSEEDVGRIYAGGGDDTITARGDVALWGGAGDDTIDTGRYTTTNAGDGDDTVTVHAHLSEQVANDHAHVTLGEGRDTLIVQVETNGPEYDGQAGHVIVEVADFDPSADSLIIEPQDETKHGVDPYYVFKSFEVVEIGGNTHIDITFTLGPDFDYSAFILATLDYDLVLGDYNATIVLEGVTGLTEADVTVVSPGAAAA